MTYLLVKVIVSSLVIVTISELANRSKLWAALLASLPIMSIIAFIWIYLEKQDTSKISELSMEITWLVIPSLVFFVSLPWLLKLNLNFWMAMILACGLTALAYFAFVFTINKLVQ